MPQQFIDHTQVGPIVQEVNYHRNGIGGDGFYVAIVTDPFADAETAGRDFLVITQHDNPMGTFVLALDDIAARNLDHAWRGDQAAAVSHQPIIDAHRAK